MNWKPNPGYCPVEDGTAIQVEFTNGNRAIVQKPESLTWKNLHLGGIARYRTLASPELQRDGDGKWWMEVPNSATVGQIAEFWEELNNV